MKMIVDEEGKILTKDGRILTIPKNGESNGSAFNDLGTIISFDDLNTIQKEGYYQFKINDNIYLMEVEIDINNINQSILALENNTIIKRKSPVGGLTWTTVEEKFITTNDVTEDLNPIGGENAVADKILSAKVGVRLNQRINNLILQSDSLSVINLGNIASIDYVTTREAGLYTFKIGATNDKRYLMIVENYLGSDYAVMQTIIGTTYTGAQNADGVQIEILTREWMSSDNSWLTRSHKFLTTQNIQDTLYNPDPLSALSARKGYELNHRLLIVEEQLSEEGIGASSEGSFKNLGAIASFSELEDVKTLGYYVVKFNDIDQSYFCMMAINYNNNGLLEQIITRYSQNGDFEILTRTFDEQNELWSDLNYVNYLSTKEIVDDLENSKGVTDKPLSANAGKKLDEKIDEVELRLKDEMKSMSIDIPIIDNLTSNLAVAALSARQGKILDDKIKNISSVIKLITPESINGSGLNEYKDSGFYYFTNTQSYGLVNNLMSVENYNNYVVQQILRFGVMTGTTFNFEIRTRTYNKSSGEWTNVTIDKYPQKIEPSKLYYTKIRIIFDDGEASFTIPTSKSYNSITESELKEIMKCSSNALKINASGFVRHAEDNTVRPIDSIMYSDELKKYYAQYWTFAKDFWSDNVSCTQNSIEFDNVTKIDIFSVEV